MYYNHAESLNQPLPCPPKPITHMPTVANKHGQTVQSQILAKLFPLPRSMASLHRRHLAAGQKNDFHLSGDTVQHRPNLQSCSRDMNCCAFAPVRCFVYWRLHSPNIAPLSAQLVLGVASSMTLKGQTTSQWWFR